MKHIVLSLILVVVLACAVEQATPAPTPTPEEPPRDALILQSIYDKWVIESSYSQKQNFVYACSKQGYDGMVTGDPFAAKVIGDFQDYLADAGIEDPVRASIVWCNVIEEDRFSY